MGGKDLTEDQIASIRDGSSLFDTDGDGRIAPSELGVLKPEPFDRPLRDAFRVLEQIRERSFTDLRHILSSIGEKLEPHEFDEWIREVDVAPDGTIRYDDFIRCSSESSGSEEDAGGGNGAGSSGPRFLGPGAAVRWGSSELSGSEEDAGGGGGAGSSGPRFLGPGAAVRWSSSESWLVDGARSRRAGLREAGGDGESLALGIDSERRSGDAERDGDRMKMPRLLEPRFVVFFFFLPS